MTPQQLDQLSPTSLGLGRRGKLGISCTGAVILDDWVGEHPARKLILHRDFKEINDGLIAIGLQPFTADVAKAFKRHLDAVDGLHLAYRDLFVVGKARKAWEHLELPGDFNDARWREMVTWHVEPHYESTIVEPDVAKVFVDKIKAAML